MDKNLEKLRKKKAALLTKKQELAKEEAKLRSKTAETKTKKRNGQIHVLGLFLNHYLRIIEKKDSEAVEAWEKNGMKFFTRDVDKKRFKEAMELIKKDLPLGTLEEIPAQYQEESSSDE